jgi:hypothetical protein
VLLEMRDTFTPLIEGRIVNRGGGKCCPGVKEWQAPTIPVDKRATECRAGMDGTESNCTVTSEEN